MQRHLATCTTLGIVCVLMNACGPSSANTGNVPAIRQSVGACKSNERLVARNESNSPIYFVVLAPPQNAVQKNRILGPLVPGETDTLAIDAQLERVAAYPDSSHLYGLRVPNNPRVQIHCVSSAIGG
jgi:hypothetical protein